MKAEDIAANQTAPRLEDATLRPRPSFAGAVRGIWLFTWKTQLALRRLPRILILLLVLPILVFLTTSPALFEVELLSPVLQVKLFSSSAARNKHPLTLEQRIKLLEVFRVETARAESELSSIPPHGVSRPKRSEALAHCFEAVAERAAEFLDEPQLAQLQRVGERRVAEAERNETRPRWTPTATFYHWLIDFYFFVVMPLTCVAASGGLIREDLQANTLGFLTTRPVTRGGLVMAKLLSQTAWLQLVLLVEALLLLSTGGLRHLLGSSGLIPLFFLAQALAVCAWASLGALLGLITRRYMALALVYGLIVEMGIGRIPTNINNLSLMRHLKALLGHDATIQSIYDWSTRSVPLAALPLVVATVLFAGLAALLFTFQEYHHTEEMQK